MKAEEHQHTGIPLDSMLSRFQVSLPSSSNAQAAPRYPGCALTPTASTHLSPATTRTAPAAGASCTSTVTQFP